MSEEGLDTLSGLLAEHADVQEQLSDPAVHSDQAKARELGKRFAQLGPIVAAARELEQTREDRDAALELADEDAGFAEEAKSLGESILEQEQKLRTMLLPRDPNDDKDIIMEIKAGEGGEESALFAGDLFRMYQRYAERNRWKFELIDATLSDLGGYKDVSIAIKVRGQAEDGAGIWQRLKHEGGVHRVQRVPVTESQGRIHTSAAGVLIYPEAEEVDVEINQNDLRIDVYRSSGPGGQSVNTTDSAVRITHEPTGIVVSCQNEKSQLQNKESAMRILRARLLVAAQEKANAEASDLRKTQVRTVDRSERVRTYNFPENRISDHRSGFKAYNLDVVLDGDLDPVVNSLIEMETAELLKGDSQ